MRAGGPGWYNRTDITPRPGGTARRLPTKMGLSEEAYEAGGGLAIGQMGGFTARIREGALPAGEYGVYIAYRTDGHDILADTGRKVKVGA